MLAVGVPRLTQAAQAVGAGELGEDQCDQMVPAAEAFVIGVPGVVLHDRLELPAAQRLEKLHQNAIREAHAPSSF